MKTKMKLAFVLISAVLLFPMTVFAAPDGEISDKPVFYENILENFIEPMPFEDQLGALRIAVNMVDSLVAAGLIDLNESPALRMALNLARSLLANPPTPPTPTPSPPPQGQASEFELRVFQLVNEQRRAHGLRELLWCNLLAGSARAHSQDMATNNFLSHTGSNGSTLRDRINAIGVRWRSAAENIAGGQRTPEAAMTSWMNSHYHRANILNPSFTHMGVGMAHNPNARFPHKWTQKFAEIR